MYEKIRNAFDYEKETGHLIWKNPPPQHAEKKGRIAGCINKGKNGNKDYWQVRCFGGTFKRSRIVFLYHHGRWPNPMVDHEDGNSLNNRIGNLRECTNSQNTMNSNNKHRSNGLPRNVYRTKQGHFMVRMSVSGLWKSFGTFTTIEDAEKIAVNKRKELYCEFRRDRARQS